MDQVRAFTAEELRELTLEPSWADAEPAERQFLIVDLRRDVEVGDAELERVGRWLTMQAVPVIGVGAQSRCELAEAADLVLSTDAELEAAVHNIRSNPTASAVLVQVLRGMDSLDVLDALALESLGYATLQAGGEFARWLERQRESRGARSVAERDDIVLLAREDARLNIVLNSPETRNSLSVAMRDALTNAFKLVAMDDSITSVEVSGNGACFSAGGDLGEFGLLVDAAEAHTVRMLRMPARYLAAHAARYHFRLHGACIGAGIELPAFAGQLTATADAFFQLPELSMGLIPGAGGCVSIPRRIGRQRTAYMAVLNKRIPAEEALAWGLVDAIVD